MQDDDDMGLHEEDLLSDDPDDVDYNEEDLGGDPNVDGGNENPTMYQMMERMTVQMEANTQYLQSMNQQIISNHQTYMGEFTHINERLDGFQWGLVNQGVQIPFMYRREARRAARGPPDMPPQDPNVPYQGP